MRQLVGNFSFDRLNITQDRKGFNPLPQFSALSQKMWQKQQRLALKEGRPFWNGKIYRLAGISRHNHKINLCLGLIDFKTHYSTPYFKDHFEKLPFAQRPNGIYIAAYLQTTDKKLVFGQKSSKSTLQNEINFIGGSLNKDELEITDSQNLLQFFVKEFEEEMGLNSKTIAKISGLGIYATDNLRIAIILACNLTLSSAEVVSQVKLNFENEKLVFFTEREFHQNLKNEKINPIIRKTCKKYQQFLNKKGK